MAPRSCSPPWPSRTPRRPRAPALSLCLRRLAIAVSGAIGVYHAGVEARVFEGFTTCTATGGLSLEDIMKVPLVRCDQVQWSLFGISMAGWNAILSLGGATLIAMLMWKASTA